MNHYKHNVNDNDSVFLEVRAYLRKLTVFLPPGLNLFTRFHCFRKVLEEWANVFKRHRE